MTKSDKTALGTRMKRNYEEPYKVKLPWRMPVIIRVDGKAFHTVTKTMRKPFDHHFTEWMRDTARFVARDMQSCVCAYVQSDEISFLLHPYKRLESQPWFDNDLQKIVTVAASSCAAHMSLYLEKPVAFDGRAFVLPEDEVVNYFIWRQQDAERNSIQMLAQSLYSHKELKGKKFEELRVMCKAKSPGWDELDSIYRRGCCIIRNGGTWHNDVDIPRFAESWDYIRSLLATEDTE